MLKLEFTIGAAVFITGYLNLTAPVNVDHDPMT